MQPKLPPGLNKRHLKNRSVKSLSSKYCLAMVMAAQGKNKPLESSSCQAV